MVNNKSYSEACEFFDEEYRPCLYTPQTKPKEPLRPSGFDSLTSTDLSNSVSERDKTAETLEGVTSGYQYPLNESSIQSNKLTTYAEEVRRYYEGR